MKNIYSRTPWLSKHFKSKKSTKTLDSTISDNYEDFECLGGNGVDDFYNDEDIKNALHIHPGLNWTGCSGINYYIGDIGTFYLYPKLLASGLKIWLYAGDTDAVVPFNGTITWLEKLKRPVKREWSPWRIVDDYICGYSIEFEGITFLTVRGTGHMVPQWKRPEAYHMVDAFLYGKDL
jgi:serine carboxypeptidase-like clade II